MDRPRVVRVPHAHRTDGNRDPRSEIIELTKQDCRQSDPYSDTYSAIQVVAVDKTLILPDIIHFDRKIFDLRRAR